MNISPIYIETKRRVYDPNLVSPPFRHVYADKYFCVLGPYLYTKIEMKIKNSGTAKYSKFLYKLSYEETENLLNVPLTNFLLTLSHTLTFSLHSQRGCCFSKQCFHRVQSDFKEILCCTQLLYL